VDLIVPPSVMVPCVFHRSPPTGGTSPALWANFYNAAFGGKFITNPTAAWTSAFVHEWLRTISKYRITAQSVTVELIASDLLNQGSIVAYQADMPPLTANATTVTSTTVDLRRDVYAYPDDPPHPSQGLIGSTGYTSKARDGCYMPLKLTRFKWQDSADSMVPINYDWVHQERDALSILVHTPTTALQFPWYEDRTGVTLDTLQSAPKLCGNNFGFIRLAGLLKGASVRVRVRQTVEVYCRPGMFYAPLLQPALPPDETALRMYFEVSGRMMDGYPASYNDLGKLKGIISGIAKKVLPYVDPALDFLANSSIPVVGTGAKIAKTVLNTGRQVAGIVKSSQAQAKSKRKPSASGR